MEKTARQFSLSLLYFIIGALINVASIGVFVISAYLNPKTYHGNEGHNNGVVLLCIMIPVWVMLLWKGRKNRDANKLIGYGINALVIILFYTIVAITE